MLTKFTDSVTAVLILMNIHKLQAYSWLYHSKLVAKINTVKVAKERRILKKGSLNVIHLNYFRNNKSAAQHLQHNFHNITEQRK